MRVVVTSEAKADLVEIGEFIRPHSPARAITFVDELLDRCAHLLTIPSRFCWFRAMNTTGLGVVCIRIT